MSDDITQTFLRHHVPIEDSDDADILVFLPAAVAFIEKEVDKSRGVLVHCVAGVSTCVAFRRRLSSF
jgi:dual specificity phosphatase 12